MRALQGCSDGRASRQEANLGQLMLRCPMTDRNFSTGIDTDGKKLKRIPYAGIAVRCPYCGLEHTSGAPRRPFGAKRPTGQADWAADALNIAPLGSREVEERRKSRQ
jgi:hypothetical protein